MSENFECSRATNKRTNERTNEERTSPCAALTQLAHSLTASRWGLKAGNGTLRALFAGLRCFGRSSVHCSLFTLRCSLFTVLCSLFFVHCSLFTQGVIALDPLVHCCSWSVCCSWFGFVRSSVWTRSVELCTGKELVWNSHCDGWLVGWQLVA